MRQCPGPACVRVPSQTECTEERELSDRNRERRAFCERREHAMTEIQALDVRIPAEIIHNWGWFLVFGIGLALLGILAIVRSVAATVVSMLFFGWLRSCSGCSGR